MQDNLNQRLAIYDEELRASQSRTDAELAIIQSRLDFLNSVNNASTEQIEQRNALEDEYRVIKEQQLEREKMQRELEELRQEKKRAEEERQNLEIEKMRNQYAAEIENSITEALETSTLPKQNPRVIRRIAQTLYQVMEMKDSNGNSLYPDVTVKDVIPGLS